MEGYSTDVITDMTLHFIKRRDQSKPRHVPPDLYQDPIKLPDTFSDDYEDRARAAAIAKMRVSEDLSYKDLGLAQPDGDRRKVGVKMAGGMRKVPSPPTDDEVRMMTLTGNEDGTSSALSPKRNWLSSSSTVTCNGSPYRSEH
ncbi:hypothetical protein N7489_003660 [Penicillium chrysogenum]|uniref:uncharacterized protein n=1 Tax=Penicillium chrysogenum TaxID=5076 RepID=UPI0024DF11CE|nr:uncharacterized protein N7489_003660 [Penicillium chrysogenum]XP_061068067.1 uncharacterized protein N7525_011621 [Penicillium rubens]KAJ5243564.1 hypothetical protein N7489_003660 [Penicillium chrysogenum]KAJ5822337.1 hypothetical protein N7525_011621 [Penicillium rubens]KAJ5859974.1 hypothetical protein N7534_005251 [Penicillium rubens]KAJ6140634.1 hypothetical protein N7497_011527 [Penicillium chrysogenum]